MISRRTTRRRLGPRAQEPMIRFVCDRSHGECLVGEVGLGTEGLWSRAVGGETAEDAQRPFKILLICPQCGHEKQISRDNISRALESVSASTRRVVQYRI